MKKRAPSSGARGSKSGKKRKKDAAQGAHDIEDDDFFEAGTGFDVSSDEERGQAEDKDEEPEETAQEKRVRLAKAYLDKLKERVAAEDEEPGESREEDEGRRDSRVSDLLRQEQLEESGRVQRKLASRVVQPGDGDVPEGRFVVRKHKQSVTAVTLTEDDKQGFSASKDGLILQWDVETGKSFKYDWPKPEQLEVLKQHMPAGNKRAPSRRVFAIAVDSSARYLATGGPDRGVHLWDVRTQKHIQVFPGHRNAVTSLVFRQGTTQLMSASYDRSIKLWSADDKSYLETLFGHQSEVLSIDCLRQERLLSAGRDRTVRLWKIPEESQLVFRGHAPSLESCCFITNTDFLSGSDDGSVSLWNIIKKKPVLVAKHAHGPRQSAAEERTMSTGRANGHDGVPEAATKPSTAESWVGAVCSCRSSDLAASGAGDGKIQLWAIEDGNRTLRALHSLPAAGFVNSLAFARSGRFIAAAIGQEPRLGRWARNANARNGVLIHRVELKEQD